MISDEPDDSSLQVAVDDVGKHVHFVGFHFLALRACLLWLCTRPPQHVHAHHVLAPDTSVEEKVTFFSFCHAIFGSSDSTVRVVGTAARHRFAEATIGRRPCCVSARSHHDHKFVFAIAADHLHRHRSPILSTRSKEKEDVYQKQSTDMCKKVNFCAYGARQSDDGSRVVPVAEVPHWGLDVQSATTDHGFQDSPTRSK
jgi:hypothetical protein